MEERRASPRRRVLKAGTIEFGGEALLCTVRNLSESGAGLEVTSPLWFPIISCWLCPAKAGRKPCRVVWRDERRVGVVFTPA